MLDVLVLAAAAQHPCTLSHDKEEAAAEAAGSTTPDGGRRGAEVRGTEGRLRGAVIRNDREGRLLSQGTAFKSEERGSRRSRTNLPKQPHRYSTPIASPPMDAYISMSINPSSHFPPPQPAPAAAPTPAPGVPPRPPIGSIDP